MPLNEPKTGDSVRETPRIYVRQEDRYEDLQSSASAFMIVCIVMSLLSLFSFGSSLHLPFSIPATPMMRFFFIFFAIGSFVIYIKTRREAAKTYARIEEEQRITEELEAWFLSSYTPGQIDLQIFGANRRPLRPEASFLVWLDCRGLNLDHDALIDLFVRRAHLALNDGEMFGPGGEGYMRINVGTPRAILCEALERLRRAVDDQ